MSIPALVVAALLFLIVFGAVCFTVAHLKATPARITAVVLAMGTLIGAMVPVVALLTEPPQPIPPVAATRAISNLSRSAEEGI
ncbi:hypothetical protein ACFYXM_35960 [Streptomyces sp. NPDC002476]|uniref:hypothetical protein n=1 Tax=Streptomyces sp. NPDC002476 TaxID=3364648 RepID=UPI003698CF1B